MKTMLYRDAIAEAQAEEMRRDKRVIVFGEDVAKIGGLLKCTAGLYKEFGPERVRDTPISDSAIAGLATGAAMAGARPVAEIMYIDFMGCCMDQVANQMAKMCYKSGGQHSVPLVLRTQCGRSHSSSMTQSQCLESWVTHIPGLKVVMPSTPRDAKGLLKTSIRDNNPVIFIEHKGLYQTKGEVPEEEYLIPLGKADVKREGKDITLISWSKSVMTCLEAAKTLSEQGIEAEVLDLRSLVPLDFDAISTSIQKTGKAVVVHEAVLRGGFGGEIIAQIQEKLFDWLDAPIARVCSLDIPVPFSTDAENESAPTPAKIISTVTAMI
jgi:pyruvate/2-oxoglutarate/acetoin dehydrogenase E1 component